jgi:hypothetical protein
LLALPKRDRGGHSEERLDERAKEQPQAGLRADAADKCTEKKGRQRGEGLLVRDVEGGVAVPMRTMEEAGKRKGELDNIHTSQRGRKGRRCTYELVGTRTKRIWRRLGRTLRLCRCAIQN